MRKILGYQNAGSQAQQYPISGAPASVNSLPTGILGSDGAALITASTIGGYLGVGGGGATASVATYGIVSSTSIDQTTAIQSACTQAALLGLGLYWPPGVYVYTGALTTNVSWIGAGADAVEIRKNTALGVGGMITVGGNCTISGIKFTSPNTPASPDNLGQETDGCLHASGVSNVVVDRCVFSKMYGPVTLFRNVTGGRIFNSHILSCAHDGFHVTGGSTADIVIANCSGEDCGDDVFPVIGYTTGAAAGQVVGVVHINCTVRGAKFGAGFKYAGTKGCLNVGCRVNGTIPASYSRPNTQQSCQALFVDTDTGGASTYGNENLQVVGFVAENCGRGASPFTSVANAIAITGTSGQTTRDIRLSDITIRRCASIGIFANGGVAGGIEGLRLKNVSIADTTDPLGYTGTAGTKQYNGITLQRVSNFSFEGSIADAGGNGISWDNTCTGEFDIKLRSYRINAGGLVGARILNSNGSTSSLSRLRMDLYIAAQVSASSGQPYYLDRIILNQAPGVTESLRVEMDLAAATNGFVLMPFSYTNPTPGSSPWVFANDSTNNPAGGRLLCIVQTSTATGLTVKRGRTGAFGAANIPTTNTTLTLAPGEALQFTFSGGAPSLAIAPCDGI